MNPQENTRRSFVSAGRISSDHLSVPPSERIPTSSQITPESEEQGITTLDAPIVPSRTSTDTSFLVPQSVAKEIPPDTMLGNQAISSLNNVKDSSETPIASELLEKRRMSKDHIPSLVLPKPVTFLLADRNDEPQKNVHWSHPPAHEASENYEDGEPSTAIAVEVDYHPSRTDTALSTGVTSVRNDGELDIKQLLLKKFEMEKQESFALMEILERSEKNATLSRAASESYLRRNTSELDPEHTPKRSQSASRIPQSQKEREGHVPTTPGHPPRRPLIRRILDRLRRIFSSRHRKANSDDTH
ncbi:MAG: hypothetical protein M1834_007198 [Cirrosporium novae-zelandiae]|nr:MAG: hypothetical protein M1834_007198 [Cirrosporium novae-zelandiae]